MNRSSSIALFAAAASLIAGPASALTYCVNTVAEIQIAINDAETNNDDDLIRIVAGTYVPPDGYFFSSTQSNSLTIRGGYNANCTVFTGATTTIDGHQQVQPLKVLIPNGGVVIENLSFVGGDGVQGGGLSVQTATGDVRIDRNTFTGNHSDLSGGGLNVFASGGDVRVRNNLVVGNSTSQSEAMSIVLTNGGDAYVVGNTIVANIADSDTATAGLGIGGDSYFIVSNNIIWNNNPGAGDSAVDFSAATPATGHSRFNNNIGTVRNGTVADFVVAEQSVDPQFQSCGGFLCFNGELRRTSPLVDAGTDSPLGGMPTRDLAYKDREIGAHVDIGAYENDLIFADGFD